MAKATAGKAGGVSDRNRSKRGVSKATQGYLLFYNFASCAAWAFILVRTVNHFAANGLTAGLPTLYANIGDDLRWIQTAAALEIIHSALGFVRSPLGTTLTQVASRLLLVWGICGLFDVPEVRTHWAFTTMTIAWSITEVVRYLFYALGLLEVSSDLLLWCRYTFFLVLYPMGAGSEAMLIYQSLSAADALYPNYGIILRGMLAIYPPGLGVMYTHMLGQRKRYLASRSSSQKKSQ
ncbi:tyrosine phosphatase-like protein [Syncephalis fuscata]|nr:tyrosine phosphatase-like protein [Syncephalis fuscata]